MSPKPMKRLFVVGRRDHHNVTLVVLRCAAAPIHGPWTLKAIVSSN